MNGRRWTALLAIPSALWAVALVAAPLSLPPGTVVALDGGANRMDHADRWEDLPGFAGGVYALGDLNCHQMASRSWSLRGNQMPMDARMVSAFGAATFGILAALRGRATTSFVEAVGNAVGGGWTSLRPAATFSLVWLVTFAPAGLDGVLQLVALYESTNPRRVATGLLLGFGLGLLLGARVRSLLEGPSGASAPHQQAA